MIIRTDAVVLRGMDYGETSRIVTLLTRDKGKVSVIARGARLPKSRYGATLQPMSYIQAVFYYKSSRGLQTLSESSHLQVYSGISRDMEKMALGLRMVELVGALVEEEQEVPMVMRLLCETFQRLDAATERVENLWPYFQLRLASVLGFAPDIRREDVQALTSAGGRLSVQSGAIDGPDSESGIRASQAALRAFAVFARADLDAVMRWPVPDEVQRSVGQLVEAFLRYHVEDAYPHRSDKVLAHFRDHFPPGASSSPRS